MIINTSEDIINNIDEIEIFSTINKCWCFCGFIYKIYRESKIIHSSYICVFSTKMLFGIKHQILNYVNCKYLFKKKKAKWVFIKNDNNKK